MYRIGLREWVCGIVERWNYQRKQRSVFRCLNAIKPFVMYLPPVGYSRYHERISTNGRIDMRGQEEIPLVLRISQELHILPVQFRWQSKRRRESSACERNIYDWGKKSCRYCIGNITMNIFQ